MLVVAISVENCRGSSCCALERRKRALRLDDAQLDISEDFTGHRILNRYVGDGEHRAVNRGNRRGEDHRHSENVSADSDSKEEIDVCQRSEKKSWLNVQIIFLATL